MRFVWTMIGLFAVAGLLGAWDEFTTRARRKKWLREHRPDLLAAQANDKAFFEIVERFRDGI